MTDWNIERVQQLIADSTEESLTLDYKRADALQKTDGKRREITKDISAMANAMGGTIIYGVAESSDPLNRHKPERLDPVKRCEFSKESLDQVIGNIRPRIDGIIIYPIPVGPQDDEVIYVVEIPQSETAHQATDYKYYKRHNFESVPMEDYEIRDVMSRLKHPKIAVSFEICLVTKTFGSPIPFPGREQTVVKVPTLIASANNEGGVYAKYVNMFIVVPARLLLSHWVDSHTDRNFKDKPETIVAKNLHRDITGYTYDIPKYGSSRPDPILPGCSHILARIELIPEVGTIRACQDLVSWSVYADNAPRRNGHFRICDIPVDQEEND